MEIIKCDKCGTKLPKKYKSKWKRIFFCEIPFYRSMSSLDLELCESCYNRLLKWIKKDKVTTNNCQ